MISTEGNFAGAFVDVSAASDYLQLVAEANGYQRVLFQMLHPREGETIVDVGCGTGQTIGKIAQLRGVRAIGVDISRELLSRSSEKFIRVHSNAVSLGLRSDLADAVIAERSLQWMDDPLCAIREARRILRSQGRMIAAEAHWQEIEMAHPNVELTRRIVVPEHVYLPNPRIAPDLPGLFKDAGFSLVDTAHIVDVLPAGVGLRVLRLDKMADHAVEMGAVSGNEAKRWVRAFASEFEVRVPVVVTRAIK